MVKYIFVTGGVLSGLGKGIVSASIGCILKSMGYKIKIKKLDGYLNVDPGLMSPNQHGEVFVTEDGYEADLDLGHYERFTDENTSRDCNITGGQIYQSLILKERRGDFLGGTVQFIPHFTNEVINFIQKDSKYYDFIICESGGTVGDVENMGFIEAFRQIKNKLGSINTMFIHLVYIPCLSVSKELKTKPAQISSQQLMSLGIQPNILICRSEDGINNEIKSKLQLFSNVENIIDAKDVECVYNIPVNFEKQKISTMIISHFQVKYNFPNLHNWEKHNIIFKKIVKIGIVGKYFPLDDAYHSIFESLKHAGFFYRCKIELVRINSKTITSLELFDKLKLVNGVIIPGGYGKDGINNKLIAIKYCRENNIPILGICLGMQLMIIEFARNVLKINANSAEYSNEGTLIVDIIPNKNTDLGGTQRLGSHKCILQDNSKVIKFYGRKLIEERHRHRYEVSTKFKINFKDSDLEFSGISPDGKLVEIIELKNHPFYIGCQFHPEFKSRPFKASPLFLKLISFSLDNSSFI